VIDTFELARRHGLPQPGPFRADGLLIASRWVLAPVNPTAWGLPWPERLLTAVVHHPHRSFELPTIHVPNASTGITRYRKGQHALGRERMMKKLETFEGVHRALTAHPNTPRVLSGAPPPPPEHPDGSVRYWQHSRPAPLRGELEARWHDAERGVLKGLRHLLTRRARVRDTGARLGPASDIDRGVGTYSSPAVQLRQDPASRYSSNACDPRVSACMLRSDPSTRGLSRS
jgi:hypothetical protein